MAALLTDLPAGHVFNPITFPIDAERSRAYRDAVGDELPLYDAEGFVPPLAVAALALGALLEAVALPPGTLHVNESLRFNAPVPAGSMLECRAAVSQRSQHGGWIVSVVDSDVILDGRSVLTARTNLLSPAAPG